MMYINVTVLPYQTMATRQLNLFHNMYVSVHIHSYQCCKCCALFVYLQCVELE